MMVLSIQKNPSVGTFISARSTLLLQGAAEDQRWLELGCNWVEFCADIRPLKADGSAAGWMRKEGSAFLEFEAACS